MLCLDVAGEFRACDAGHEVVGNYEVNWTGCKDVQGLLGRERGYHIVASFLEHQLAEYKRSLFIIDT
jgi:hypothetical protein